MRTMIGPLLVLLLTGTYSLVALGEDVVASDPQPSNVTTARNGASLSDPIPATGMGTLTGRILWNGPRPKPKLLDYAAPDMEGWKRDGYSGTSRHRPSWAAIYFDEHFRNKGLTDQSLLVSETGGMANVFVYIRPNSKLLPRWTSEKPLPTAQIAFVAGQLEPRALIVQPETPLAVSNRMKTEMIDVQFDQSPGSTTILAGKTISASAVAVRTREGVPIPHKLRSNFAAWLAGFVLVLDHPCGAISNDAGEFRIDGIPPGEWEFIFWHEETGWLKSDRYPKGRDKISIAPGLNPLGDLRVAENAFPKPADNKANEKR